MKTYMGEVCRVDGQWAIYIPEIHGHTSTVHPEQNDMAARELISLALGLPLDDVRVMLEVVDR